jgi:hypothetical protein
MEKQSACGSKAREAALAGACRGMVRHLRRFFENAAVLQVSGDPVARKV